ncbi:50S ribosomal protein L3 [Alphaproteobacteria bacterium]|nr:50S ribosomal protein L3 [Alphaproteobacteria bacterium]
MMILGKKLGQTSFIDNKGNRVCATVLDYKGCSVVGNRTEDKDGYIANIIGFAKPKKLKNPQQKEFIKKNIEPRKHIKEERLNTPEKLIEVGLELKVDFLIGDKVVVQSTSTGKGFAGVMKRHNFGGLRASHGVSTSHRSAGGTGQNQNPGRVFKGKKMAGHLGDETVTQKGLEVLKVDQDNSLIFIKGSVPGKRSTIVRVYK